MKKEIYSAISKFYPFKSLDSFALTYHSINDFNHDFTPKLYQLQLDSFFEQIRFLKHKNIESPDHVEDLFNPNRKCILTFDRSCPTTVEPACKVHGCKVNPLVRSIFGWSQS